MFLCYLLNPIVVLFADDEGELHGWLHYFQTHDDSLDSEFYMKECVPAFLDYGYNEHYYSVTDVDYFDGECVRTYSKLKENCSWTTKERIQRYCCRVLWLYRNCAYGFCHYFFGQNMENIEWKKINNKEFYGVTGNKWLKPFVYKNENEICKHLEWKVYIGWKAYPNQSDARHCMIASRVWLNYK